jgi:hypothetical protein
MPAWVCPAFSVLSHLQQLKGTAGAGQHAVKLAVKTLNDPPTMILFVAQHDSADLMGSKSSDAEVSLPSDMPCVPGTHASNHLQLLKINHTLTPSVPLQR